MIDRVDVVVLAGGGGIEEGGCAKALVSLDSRLMVDYVVEALAGSQNIEKIALVGDNKEMASLCGGREGLFFAEQGATPLQSFAAGVEALGETSGWIMACTGDIPFLTVEAIDDFISRCREREADFYYPIVKKETVEKRFPGAKRTYAGLKDGAFTGGNIFLISREAISGCLPVAEDFVRLRKKPAALARLVGFGILWKYVFGQLTIAEAEQRVSEIVGARGLAVISGYPEIGVDVDKASDLQLARSLLEAD